MWLPIKGWEGFYDVSDDGQVRSLKYHGLARKTPRILKTYPHTKSYKLVRLQSGSRSVPRYVHRLVLETFVGECPAGKEAGHRDGHKQNNALSNLEWITRPENVSDKYKHGHILYGERNGFAKLTATQVQQIRQSASSHAALARQFGVAETTVADVRHGKTWAKLEARAAGKDGG